MVEIARDGCVVTEQWMGMHADRHVFPRRNRLIAALSHAVVVVEGGLRSGALITARWALEQGRDVGAVPGFPGDFRSAGPNQLLRQGAFVVETATDILDAVPLLRRSETPGGTGDVQDADNPGGAAGVVLGALGSTSWHPDEIAGTTGLPIAEVLGAIVQLEMAGRVVCDDAGGVTRMKK
jgi:DNA processing protein